MCLLNGERPACSCYGSVAPRSNTPIAPLVPVSCGDQSGRDVGGAEARTYRGGRHDETLAVRHDGAGLLGGASRALRVEALPQPPRETASIHDARLEPSDQEAPPSEDRGAD